MEQTKVVKWFAKLEEASQGAIILGSIIGLLLLFYCILATHSAWTAWYTSRVIRINNQQITDDMNRELAVTRDFHERDVAMLIALIDDIDARRDNNAVCQ